MSVRSTRTVEEASGIIKPYYYHLTLLNFVHSLHFHQRFGFIID